MNEVVNGVFTGNTCPATDITLALIPVGTGNDWGRMFGIPLDYEKAVKIIGEGKNMLHDIGMIRYSDALSDTKRYFINIAGLGFESMVVKRTNIQKDKGHSGKLIYFYNLLMSLLSYKNTKAEINIDGKSIMADVFSINVGNGKYCGGGMRQTPDALPNDGFLDVTIINGMGKLEIIRNLKMLYDGTILNHPKISGYRCKNIKVSSDSILYIEADGESLGHTPAEFSIVPSMSEYYIRNKSYSVIFISNSFRPVFPCNKNPVVCFVISYAIEHIHTCVCIRILKNTLQVNISNTLPDTGSIRAI